VADTLAAALTNAYYSEVDLVIVYDPSDNRLYFTETPEAIIDPLIPVVGVPLISIF
jgi:hypothetical protein